MQAGSVTMFSCQLRALRYQTQSLKTKTASIAYAAIAHCNPAKQAMDAVVRLEIGRRWTISGLNMA
jgi:hypothetical protein